MNLKTYYKITILLALVTNFGCIEPFTLVTESFEDALVVEATITDELKTQQIKLTRTFPLEGGGLVFENGANVKIIGSNNNEYSFINTNDGVYNSVIEFKVEHGISYRLLITTSDGKEYVSNDETLPEVVGINKLEAELVTSNENQGIQVFVDSDDSSGETNYFRYEYEETYQRIPELFFRVDLVFSNVTGSGESIQYTIAEEPRPENQRVCYSNNNSNEIIVTSTDGLTEQRVSKFPVRFIRADDFIIRDRYSILVKQYNQSADANNYFRILKDISSDESLLIDQQPGFVQGNLFSTQNSNEKVIGFFDVSSVSSKRIFFSYDDFEIAEKPQYPFFCETDTLSYNVPDERPRLYELVANRGYKHGGSPGNEDELDFLIVRPECGDCTSYASNVRPEFWED